MREVKFYPYKQTEWDSGTIDGTVEYNTVEKHSNMKIVKSVRAIEILYF